jgi:hypothetical protein
MFDLNRRAVTTTDKQALSVFINDLADSLLAAPEDWANLDLERFLRAWSAWLADSDGYFLNRGEEPPQDPSWTLIAQMLLAARVYE